jgi:hypothetical protein
MENLRPEEFIKHWPEGFVDTFNLHTKTPEIGFETYRNINRVTLAHKVLKKKRIYLDTMYWVRFRDLALGRLHDTTFQRLFDVLHNGCIAGRLICPLSYSAVSELLNQGDRETRLATALLMDQLSNATCIQPPHYLFSSEIEYFLSRSLLPTRTWYATKDMAWTKAAFFVGAPVFSLEGLPASDVLAIQKSLEDALTEMNVVTLAATIPGRRRRDWMKNLTKDTVEKLNIEKIKPPHLLKNYKDLVKSEVWGALDGYKDILVEALCHLVSVTGCRTPPTEDKRIETGKMLRDFIGSLYQHEKISCEIPQLHIGSSLHALVRHDHRRKYKMNDLEDFRHAGAALPYCDVFLTEKSLGHMICQSPSNLRDKYDCIVISDPQHAVQQLESLCD